MKITSSSLLFWNRTPFSSSFSFVRFWTRPRRSSCGALPASNGLPLLDWISRSPSSLLCTGCEFSLQRLFSTTTKLQLPSLEWELFILVEEGRPLEDTDAAIAAIVNFLEGSMSKAPNYTQLKLFSIFKSVLMLLNYFDEFHHRRNPVTCPKKLFEAQTTKMINVDVATITGKARGKFCYVPDLTVSQMKAFCNQVTVRSLLLARR